MIKPFQRWPKEIPEVGKKIRINFDNGHILETTVIQRGTHNGFIFHIELESPNMTLSINLEEAKKKMRDENTNNEPLWEVISDRAGEEGKLVNIFVLAE